MIIILRVGRGDPLARARAAIWSGRVRSRPVQAWFFSYRRGQRYGGDGVPTRRSLECPELNIGTIAK